MVSIAAALARIKDDGPDAVLSRGTIEGACRAHVPGGDWRDTPLAPPEALALLIRQVAHGNCSCAELARLAGGRFTAAGYCDARRRLPLAAVEDCGRRVYDAAAARCPGGGRWRGRHRVWLVDGSGVSMPDAPPLQREFGQSGQQRPGCGFPVSHVLGPFDLHTGLVARAAAAPLRTHDLRDCPLLHPAMAAGDVLLGDDAFGTYAHLALLLRRGLHGLFPVHHKRIVDFAPGRPHTHEGKGAARGVTRARWVRSLGADDQVVEWAKPAERPAWLAADEYAALPDAIEVRETRRTVRLGGGRRVTVTTVCTLLDADAYPAAAIVGLRQRRWEVEVDLRHLKTTMGMDVLRCRTVAGVRKEIAAFLLVYNLVRAIVCAAARRRRVGPGRVSFADALYWARHAHADDPLPRLRVNPHRPWRVEPRALKRRAKGYPLLNRPRDELRQALLGKAVRA